ncbi:CLEC10A isoform 6, partial [Pongo abelii]
SSLEETIASLKAEVEGLKQERQAVHSEMLLRVQQLVQDLNKLTCQVATLNNNASTEGTCCPVSWVEHQDSCYWFSRSGMSWAEAEKYCQLKNAHLVVINSREEQELEARPARRLAGARAGWRRGLCSLPPRWHVE